MAVLVFFTSLIIFTLILTTHQTINDATVHVLYKWTFVDYQYPSEQAHIVAVNQGTLTPENSAMLDTDYYFSHKTSTKRIFATTPQFRSGIPATLSEVSKQTNSRGEYMLKPFPNWDSVGTASCEFAVSVYRIFIDRCGLLWVLDTGRVDTFTNPRRICRPKLLIYDLNNNDALIERYEFTDNSITDRSNLITIVTESYRDDCRDSIAYISDVNAYGLVVFDLAQRRCWRVEHRFFYPFPMYGSITVEDVTFDLMDGVFGIALGPGDPSNRKLYFHSLASARESWIPVEILKNSSLVQQSNVLREYIGISEEARVGQSSLEVMTDDGILIFSLLPQTAIGCWNSATPFTKDNLHIIYQDRENLQFISGMKLKSGKTLLITTSRLQNYIVDNLNYTDVKYRMIVIDDVNQLLKDTPCKDGGSYSGVLSAETGPSIFKVGSSSSSKSPSSSTKLPPTKSTAPPPKQSRPANKNKDDKPPVWKN